jgi:hypothetical protein
MTHATEMTTEIIGKHVNTVLGNDSIDWTGYWPVVDPDDLTVTAISDGDDDELVLADVVYGGVLVRDGASDVLIQRQGDLVLVRSDTGDGGWSLHPAGSTDEQIASGDAPYLVSGTAQWVDGDWDRPNAQDYAKANED